MVGIPCLFASCRNCLGSTVLMPGCFYNFRLQNLATDRTFGMTASRVRAVCFYVHNPLAGGMRDFIDDIRNIIVAAMRTLMQGIAVFGASRRHRRRDIIVPEFRHRPRLDQLAADGAISAVNALQLARFFQNERFFSRRMEADALHRSAHHCLFARLNMTAVDAFKIIAVIPFVPEKDIQQGFHQPT